MKSHTIIILLLSLCLFSCKKGLEEIKNNELNHFKDFVKKETYSEIETNPLSLVQIIYPHAIYADGYSGVILLEDLSEKEFDLKVRDLEKKVFFKSSLLDTTKYYTPNIKQLKETTKFPIPKLDDEILRLSDTIDVNNSYILGLREENGAFFEDKFIEDIRDSKELKEIQHLIGNGFSNGAIIDNTNKRILHWIIVW